MSIRNGRPKAGTSALAETGDRANAANTYTIDVIHILSMYYIYYTTLANTYTIIYVYIYIYICMCVYIYIYICIRTHTYNTGRRFGRRFGPRETYNYSNVVGIISR